MQLRTTYSEWSLLKNLEKKHTCSVLIIQKRKWMINPSNEEKIHDFALTFMQVVLLRKKILTNLRVKISNFLCL